MGCGDPPKGPFRCNLPDCHACVGLGYLSSALALLSNRHPAAYRDTNYIIGPAIASLVECCPEYAHQKAAMRRAR